MTAKLFAGSVFLTIALLGSSAAQSPAKAPSASTAVRFDNYHRTELYMGMSIPGGSMVSDDAWEKFLNDVVTPLFPEGFSVLSGRGQYREASGVIAKEPSHVLVFLYKKADRKAAGAKIEKIRSEYKKQFSQVGAACGYHEIGSR